MRYCTICDDGKEQWMWEKFWKIAIGRSREEKLRLHFTKFFVWACNEILNNIFFRTVNVATSYKRSKMVKIAIFHNFRPIINLKILPSFNACCMFLYQSISVKFSPCKAADTNLQNVLLKLSIQTRIKKVQKVNFTIFFVIPTTCNFFKTFLRFI